MDQMNRYRDLLKRILSAHVALVNRTSGSSDKGGIPDALVVDDEHGQYLWMRYGWAQGNRVRAIPVYAHISDGKIWIEEDWTEAGIATELVAAGVPKEDIVLAFHSPEMRVYTDFAAA